MYVDVAGIVTQAAWYQVYASSREGIYLLLIKTSTRFTSSSSISVVSGVSESRGHIKKGSMCEVWKQRSSGTGGEQVTGKSDTIELKVCFRTGHAQFLFTKAIHQLLEWMVLCRKRHAGDTVSCLLE